MLVKSRVILLSMDRGIEFYQDESGYFGIMGTQAGVGTAMIIHDIKKVIQEQAAIMSEGRSLLDFIDDCQKKQQLSIIVNLLNVALQNSSERLAELLDRCNSA